MLKIGKKGIEIASEMADVADTVTGGTIPAVSMGRKLLKGMVQDDTDTIEFLKDLDNRELKELIFKGIDELGNRSR